MKLRRLDVLAFGSLREASLELDANALHVIYGPNEAGKSTALRALTGLFYRIPENTKDAHSIEASKLRVGALLCDARGRELQVVRRKGRKDTLLGADGQPLTAADENWLTAGIAESTFHSLFGLNFATLHSGAEELLGSAGDLGQSLFSAALGGGRVRRVLEDLEAEAAALFKPRGRVQQLNAAVLQFEAAKKQSRDDSTKQSTLSDQQAGIEAAELECQRLNAEVLTLRAERERLERARRVLPLLAKFRGLQLERATLGPVPRLAPDAPRERRKAVAEQRDAQLRLEHEHIEIGRLEQKLLELRASAETALADLPASQVELLRDRLSGYRRCVRALPAKAEALARARVEVEHARARLQLPAADAHELAIERLRLPKPLEARVREHLRVGAALRTRLADLQRTAAGKRDQLVRLRQKLWQLWGSNAQLEQAPLLMQSALPTEAACDRFERTFGELAEHERALQRKREELEGQLERNQSAREALSLSGAPPSEAELTDVRAARGVLWTQLRTQLSDAAHSDVPSRVGLLDRGVQLTDHADSLADRLRREATRVADAANLSAEQASIERSLAKLDKEQTLLLERSAKEQGAWQAHFQDAGLPARSTRDARALLATQRALEAQAEQLERELTTFDRDIAGDSQTERQWSTAWQALSQELGVSDHTGAAELEALLEARAELLARHDAAQSLQQEVQALERERREFAADVAKLCVERAPHWADEPAELAAERLIEAHRKTHAALVQVEQLQSTLATRREAGGQAERELARTERHLGMLMHAAGVAELSALEAVEVNSARATELESALSQLQTELATACDGRDPEQVASEVTLSLDDVRVRLNEVEDQLGDVDVARQDATHQLASKRGGLEHLHQKHAAGDAAVEAMSHLDQVRVLTERYVRVRLAASVLKREIERYRERNRAPVLRVAAELFQRLTLGAYAGLDADYGEHDEPVLVCVRADQKRLTVGALSTGTRDQLYLALRLASIAHLAEQKEPMPLILDDILVHFDDERARAALITLADFAQTTQVLFFTHHQRLCELAQSALAPERVRIQRLTNTVTAPLGPSYSFAGP
ncbi:MAG: hypothetical protein RL701_2258 [Pseudomonadota bacterium]